MKKENTNNGYKVVTNNQKSDDAFRTFMLILFVAFVTFVATSTIMYKILSKTPKDVISVKTLMSKDTSIEGISETLQQYRQIIDKFYLKDVNEEDLKEGAIKGYIDGLGDEYTKYISPEEMEEYLNDIEGEFVGVGVVMIKDKVTGRIRILALTKDGPAYRAGIQVGDYIKSINGKEYSAEEMSNASEDLKGDGNEGSEINLEIIRGDQIIPYTLKTEIIKVNPVESEMLENDIGYISFASFDRSTTEDFKKEYEDLKSKGMKSLIIDIRNNGGGIVDQAQSIAGLILDKDSTVLYEIDKSGNEKEIKTETDPIIDVPIVMLVNENSASASEILAGALKDYGKAKIVGTTTYGKGVIQDLLSLPDGSGLKITCEEYLTPKKNKINEIGIEPDEKVELPEDVSNYLVVEKDKDTQLKKAIEMLK